MQKQTCLGWLLTLAAFVLLSAPAQAGIIITEGKIAEEQDASKEPTKETSTGRRTFVLEKVAEEEEDQEDTPDTCTELDDDGFCVQVDASVGDVSMKEVGDLTNDDPEGWDCTPVGAGLEVCEPSGPTGSSPGAGAGGGLGMDGLGSESGAQAGCQGSGGTPAWFGFVLMALAFMVSRTRALSVR